MDLFRREALEARREDWLGSVRLVSLKMGWPVAITGAALTLFLVLFLLFGEYTRSESVRGQLVPSSGLLPLMAATAGIVTQKHIGEGEFVEKDQALVEISSERASGTVGKVGAAVALELKSQRARLMDELEGLDEIAAREQAQLQRRLDFLGRQLSLSDTQLALRQQQMTSAQALLGRVAPVRDSGQLTALQLQQYKSQALEAEIQFESAQLQRVTVEQDIAEIEAKVVELPAQMENRRRELEQSLAEINQAIARNEGERSVVIRAPRAGMISGLSIAGGQSVSAGQILLAIIPEASELQAQLWVPASAIGRVAPGGRVAMRYDSFPYQQFGLQYGRIIQIAQRAMKPEEIRSSTGLELDQPAYRVSVALDRQQIQLDGRAYKLRSNMTLEAALLLDNNRLIEMLGLYRPDTTMPVNDVVAAVTDVSQ